MTHFDSKFGRDSVQSGDDMHSDAILTGIVFYSKEVDFALKDLDSHVSHLLSWWGKKYFDPLTYCNETITPKNLELFLQITEKDSMGDL